MWEDIIKLYKQKNDYIIICADFNAYNTTDINYNLAAKYVNIPVVYYIDIIKNAERIHIVDSCFSCIVIPLLNMTMHLLQLQNFRILRFQKE